MEKVESSPCIRHAHGVPGPGTLVNIYKQMHLANTSHLNTTPSRTDMRVNLQLEETS